MPYTNQTPEQIAAHYEAALKSCDVIDVLAQVTQPDEEQLERLDCNIRHLEITLTWAFWTTEDLTPFEAAIATGKAAMAQTLPV